MVTPGAFALPRQQAPEVVIGTGKKSTTMTSTALWVFGLLAASTAITVVVCVPPPPALHKNAYFLAVSCFFFAGVAGVMSAVVCMVTTTTTHRDGDTTGRKLMYVLLLARLASAVGAAFINTTALGMLGLVAASTAITVAVCVPPPEHHEIAYFLAISCFFFAGVTGIMSAAVFTATTTTGHWRKLMCVLVARLSSVVGAAFSTTTALGVIGLAATSTAIMNLQFVCQPRGVNGDDCYYHIAVSVVFFAGVAAVMAAVTTEGGQQVAK